MRDAPALATRRRVPVTLGRLVDACLRRDPKSRPSLPAVAAELESWLASRGVADAATQ